MCHSEFELVFTGRYPVLLITGFQPYKKTGIVFTGRYPVLLITGFQP